MKSEHWVTFYAPGSFTANTWRVDVKSEHHPVDWPDNAYAYQRRERKTLVSEGLEFKSDAQDVGPLVYHPDSVTTTIEQVRAGDTPGDPGGVLLRNMEWNGWDKVIWTRWGNWPQPWKPDAMVIDGQPGGVAPESP